MELNQQNNTHGDYVESTAGPERVDLAQVKLEKVIDENKLSKMITFQGVYRAKPIVIRLEKIMFNELDTKQALGDKETQMDQSFLNDIYSSYSMTPAPSAGALNRIQATIIWPANDTVLAKYTHDDAVFVEETKDDFANIVAPFIDNKLNSDRNYNNWVYNILEGRSEAERVIYNDQDPDRGFLIIPDLKWSGSMDDVNLLAICHRRDIKSMRDLNGGHLALLENISLRGSQAIREKFQHCKGELRSYVHYHPSFYHFHVHFRIVDASGYQSTDRDNLLSTIINNIKLVADYYERSTLTYPLSKSNRLYDEFRRAGRLA